MSNNFEIITLGYILNENIQFPDSTVGPFLGGTVSYSSVVLGRLDTRVGIVSNVGTDIPATSLNTIRESGVDTCGLHVREDSPTTTNILIYDTNGNKVIKYLKKAPKIRFSDITLQYFNCKLMYFCPVDFDVEPKTVKRIKAKGVLTAADMGGFGGAHSSEESRYEFQKDRLGNLEAYTKHIDIAKVSMEDCYHIFGDGNMTELEAVKRLQNAGIKICIMTLGDKGSLIVEGNSVVNIPPVPVKAVDTTGAGDTYIAAFLSEYIKNKDIRKSGQFASATSSLLIEKTGGVNIERVPDREMVMERVKYFKD